jgi:hypothetical protein
MALFQTVNISGFTGPTGATGTGIPVAGNRVVSTERGGTIASGGTRQAVCAANASRTGFAFQNLSTGDLWLRFNSAAAAASQPSLKIVAGAYYEMPSTGIQPGAIDVFGATTGQAFSAWEW